jgi:orotidine-5'-phosphate decarboxylase
MNFRAALTARQIAANSLLCVGLDPLIEKMPQAVLDRYGCHTWEEVPKDLEGTVVLFWMKGVVDKTAAYASMFKPQRAHWEAIVGGAEALQDVVAYIHEKYPDIPVFLDCKRGDIDRTQRQYRDAHFLIDGVDGMNYNGYMGKDTLRSLIDPKFPGRALVGLGRTSNPAAWQVQDRRLHDDRMVWEAMVEDILDWSTLFGVLENAGVVMGAAHKHRFDPEVIEARHLVKARAITGNALWYLIPGIGTQGGFVEETIKAAYMGAGSIAINSSSGIIFADDPGAAAKKLRDEINLYVPYHLVAA